MKATVRLELAIVLGFSAAAGVYAYWRSSTLHPVLYSYSDESGVLTSDIWFDADIPKQIALMSDRSARQHSIASEHPLMSLLFHVPAQALRAVTGSSVIEIARLMWSAMAALWTAAMFGLLRQTGSALPDATVLTLLGMVSAAAVFWFAVPEAFAAGSLTIVLSLCVLQACVARERRFLLLVGANLLALSITITNCVPGIVGTFLLQPWRRAGLVLACALGVATALWGVERLAFPKARYFLTDSRRLSEFTHRPTAARTREVTRAFVLHTVLMPEIIVKRRGETQQVLSVQQSGMTESRSGQAAALGWFALVSLGVVATSRARRQSPVTRVAVISLLAQFSLHLAFGRETFLYSMHFLPLLLLIVSTAMRTRLRVPALILALLVVVSGAITNQRQFSAAAKVVRQLGG